MTDRRSFLKLLASAAAAPVLGNFPVLPLEEFKAKRIVADFDFGHMKGMAISIGSGDARRRAGVLMHHSVYTGLSEDEREQIWKQLEDRCRVISQPSG